MVESSRLRVFISSVQSELEHERAAVAQLISTDPFLLKHCKPVLYDKEPSAGRPNKKGYLECLQSCQIYLLLVDIEYGRLAGDLSATHEEYRFAQKAHLPSLIFMRGLDNKRDDSREQKTRQFIDEIKRDGYKYVRFHDREDLKPSARDDLYAVLKGEFQIRASLEESEEGEHLIEVASSFETTPMPDVSPQSLDQDAVADLVEAAIEQPGLRIWDDSPEHALVIRGLASFRPGERATITRAAFLLFAPTPANRFPQCEILADAYDETRISAKPKGQLTINAPLLRAVAQALKFVDDHTFHPRRVVGLNNVRLDEYPIRALREALINAVAHRTYDDATRKILLRIFSDRIEIASPGYPPKPLTLAKLRTGDYRPCSRNPLITQTLALLNQMEQRGTGMARMRDAMLDHGLDVPALGENDGYFVVTLSGPAGDYDRIRPPSQTSGPITPAIEKRLNERQKAIMIHVQQEGNATNKWVQEKCRVVRDTAHRDLQELVAIDLLKKVGKGRATRYELARPDE